MVNLCCMHEEWMAQKHRARPSGSAHLGQSLGRARGCKAQFHHRQAGFSSWSQ